IPCSAYPTIMPNHFTTLTSILVTTQEEPVQTAPTALDTPLSIPDVSTPGELEATQGEHVSPITQGEQLQDSTATPTSVEATKTSAIATGESDASSQAFDTSLNILLANLPPLQTTTNINPSFKELSNKTKLVTAKPPLPTRKSSRLASF
ncbi:hypothetical protein PanWU01x14_251010, partial [Parasponia andersonii]